MNEFPTVLLYAGIAALWMVSPVWVGLTLIGAACGILFERYFG